MHKTAAKALVQDLKKKTLGQFAFAPNGRHPFLMVGKRPFSLEMVKQQSEEVAGVLFRTGPVFVGEIERDGQRLVFAVDKRRSKGQIDEATAQLGLRVLLRQLEKVGANVQQLRAASFRLGDAAPTAEADHRPTHREFQLAREGWPDRIAPMEQLWQAIQTSRADGTPLPKGRTPDEAQDKLAKAVQALENEITLALDRVQRGLDSRERRSVTEARRRLGALRDAMEPERVARRAEWSSDYAPVQGVVLPDGLPEDEKHIRPLLAAMNEALAGGEGRTADALADQAEALAQACAERLVTLKGRFFKGKADKRKITALLAVQQDALATAAAVRAQAMMRDRGEEVHGLFMAGQVERTAAGRNGAQALSDDEGEVRFIAKLVDPANDAKVKEMGQEVVSSALSDLLSTSLGIPSMVTRTTATVVPTPDGPRLAAVQDAFKVVGEISMQKYATLQIGEHTLVITQELDRDLKKAATLGSYIRWEHEGVYAFMRRTLAKQGIPVPDSEEELTLLARAVSGHPWPGGGEWRPLPVDEEDLAEDLAHTALIDLITGQADHRTGKGDNVLVVEVDGVPRVRPIDFGLALQDIDGAGVDVPEFGAWTSETAAARPFDPELVDRLLQLEEDDVIGVAEQAGSFSATLTRDPRMKLSEGALTLLRTNLRMVRHGLRRARERGVDVSPRDLAALIESDGKVLLAALVQASRRETPPWMFLVDGLMETFDTSLDAWLDDVERVSGIRLSLEGTLRALYEAVQDAEADPETVEVGVLDGCVNAVRVDLRLMKEAGPLREPDERAWMAAQQRCERLTSKVAALTGR